MEGEQCVKRHAVGTHARGSPPAKEVSRFTQRMANKYATGRMASTQILGRPSTKDRASGGYRKQPAGRSLRYKNPALLEKLDTKTNVQKLNILKRLGSISGINLMLDSGSTNKNIF